MVRYLMLAGAEVLLGVLLSCVTPVNALGQTPFVGALSIRLLPGYTHERLQGIDSVVGKLVKSDAPEIRYEMGRIPPSGAPRLGGDFLNAALRLPEQDRHWLKEQTVGSRHVHIAYSRDHLLIVSTASAKEGINFTAVTKTPEQIADVLLMALSLARQDAKQD